MKCLFKRIWYLCEALKDMGRGGERRIKMKEKQTKSSRRHIQRKRDGKEFKTDFFFSSSVKDLYNTVVRLRIKALF